MEIINNGPIVKGAQLANRHILVCYATGYGSTQQVAEFIGKLLQEEGASVDVKNIQTITQLENYDAVIVGSPIQYDTWVPVARNFVKNNTALFKKIPVAYFFNCLTLAKRNEKTLAQANKYADTVRSINSEIQPVSIGQFAGAVKLSVLPIVFKLLFYFLLKFVGVKEGDYRDWDAITAWTNKTVEKMALVKQ